MAVQDSLMMRDVMRDFGRYPLDVSDLRVSVSGGVVYLNGSLKPLRGFQDDTDVDEVLGSICKRLRSRPGVRDIIIDLSTPTQRRFRDTRDRRRRLAL